MAPWIKILRSLVAGNRPTGRSYGEPYVNFADGQFGVFNNSNVAQDLLGVPMFSTGANYAVGNAVNYQGKIYIANTAVSAGSFTASQWSLVLSASLTGLITVGYTFTPYNIGSLTSPFTPNPALGNYQYGNNTGAVTFNPPANDCAMDILLTNISTAGAVNFSGYTAGTTGDPFDTTNGHRFLISIRRINGVATYVNKALQ